MTDAATRLEFRPPHDPQLWNVAQPGVTLVAVEIAGARDGARALTVEGVCRGLAGFELTAATAGAPVTASSTADPARAAAFRVTLTVPAASGSCHLVASAGGVERDRVAFLLTDGPQLDLPSGRLAGLEPERSAFLAGTSDRTVRRLAFQLLYIPGTFASRSGDDLLWYSHAAAPPPDSRLVDVERMRADLAPKLRQLTAELRADARATGRDDAASLAAHRARRRELVAAALESAAAPLGDEHRKRIDRALRERPAVMPRETATTGIAATRSRQPIGAPPPPPIPRLSIPEPPPPPQLPDVASDVGVLVDAGRPLLVVPPGRDGMIVDVIEGRLFGTDLGGRVGVMFGDRVRFRPAGLVVGEPLYTLALTPGEEVQVRQSVETRREARLEEIVDREQEHGLTLSSAWSTDVTQSLTDTLATQEAFTLGGGMNAGPFSLPQGISLPIGANVGMSTSFSQADTSTRERTAKVTRELTAQATAKLRRQHKTTIEITSAETSALATTRTIRNGNQQRAVTYLFSKIYRREQVTLERHDARLCLRLVVDDPGAGLRETFRTWIERLDPRSGCNQQQSAGDDTDAPLPEVIARVQELSVSDPEPPEAFIDLFPRGTGWETSWGVEHTVTLTPGATAEENARYVDYELFGEPTFEVVEYELRDSGGVYIPEGNRVYQGADAHVSFVGAHGGFEIRELDIVSARPRFVFLSYGDRWHYVVPAHVDTRDPRRSTPPRLAVRRTVRFTFRLTTYWKKRADAGVADSPAGTAATEGRSGAPPITREAVLGIRDHVLRDLQGALLAAAATQHLSFPANRHLAGVRHLFAFEDAVFELVPYWATEAGRANYEQMARILRALPVPVSPEEAMMPLLTAAQAVVYLPIREGHERAALPLLAEVQPDDIDWLVDEVQGFRAAHFAAADLPLPTYTDVVGPVPPMGTPAGATAWTTAWEQPQQRFDVLAAWQELVPTDGVHVEPILSDGVATDEHRTGALERPER